MKFIYDRINVKVFMLSLAFGLLICYLTLPTPDIIFQHPNPTNLNTVYKNTDENTCYKYTGKQVMCNINSKDPPLNEKDTPANDNKDTPNNKD
jgi:hypothetical protein